MKIKSILILFVILIIAAFSFFVLFYESHVRSLAMIQIDNHAEVIASSLWSLEKSSPMAYLTLAAKANGYDRLVVLDETGGIFLDVRGPERADLDQLFVSLDLIPIYRLESNVIFEGKAIGRISAVWPCRTIYFYLYILFCLFLFLMTIWFFLKLFDANRTLEMRVRERTAELEKENSERRRAEEELRAHSQRLSLHVQHTPLGVIEWDVDLRVVDWNNAAERIFGYTREEALGRSAFDLIIPPSVREQVTEVWRNLLSQTGGTQSVNQNTTKGGEAKTCEWYNTTLTDSEGAVIGIAALVQDVTERIRIEEALRLTQFCFDRASIGIFRVGQEDGRILDVNEQGCRSLGYTREELLDRSIFDIDPLLTREKWEKRTAILSQRGSDLTEADFRRKDGSTLPVEILTNSIKFEDAELSISFVLDITDRKEAEKDKSKLEVQLLQAQKMKAVGELAGGIAHDFNNILQGIVGYTQLLLLESSPQSKSYSRLKEIEWASVRAADLIRQLLTFSRKIESNLKPINLNHEIAQMRDLLERTFPKMISIELSLDEKLQEISADSGQIEQIIMNLSINAMHAMPAGGKLIIETSNVFLDEEFCRTHLDAQQGEYVLLTVSDSGLGMDQDTLDRIYEPFFTTKGVGKGTGLGLSMVYGIVSSHRGYIKCYSELGKGTIFKIWFPALVRDQANEEEVRVVDAIPTGTETVLIVDDDLLIREIGKGMLARFGYKCFVASSGEEGLDIYAIRKEEIDLVILDLNMPGMGGYNCLQELKKVNPAVKVLVASGYSRNGSLRHTLAEGASGFIGKPYLLSEFLRTVRETLDGV
jgi:two-component system, cell cycle sensor histidine kinase and response regulator CckA